MTVETLNRMIKFISAECACDDPGGCNDDWIKVTFTADPPFSVTPMEPYGGEFLSIERHGLSFIRERIGDLKGAYFLDSQSPMSLDSSRGGVLLFRKCLDPNSISANISIEIIKAHIASNGAIMVYFRETGLRSGCLGGVKKYMPLWEFLENRALEYLCSNGIIEPGTYRLDNIKTTDVLVFTPVR